MLRKDAHAEAVVDVANATLRRRKSSQANSLLIKRDEIREKFQVSRRMINRDIEDICRAGIPIMPTQGADGGIKITEGFQLDTTVFTEEEKLTKS